MGKMVVNDVKASLEVKLCSQAYLHAFGGCRRRHAGVAFICVGRVC